MKKHFVEFMSPGTFVCETSRKPIDSWDVDKAVEMSKDIEERYGATPYAFQFITKERKDGEWDSRVVDTSNLYYLGGTVYTYDEIKDMKNPSNDILLQNMKHNKWEKVIFNSNSWDWAQPVREGDVVLEV